MVPRASGIARVIQGVGGAADAAVATVAGVVARSGARASPAQPPPRSAASAAREPAARRRVRGPGEPAGPVARVPPAVPDPSEERASALMTRPSPELDVHRAFEAAAVRVEKGDLQDP